MSTRQYNNYADLITFSRASGGTALRPISYGPELVTNGTFDTDTDWTKGTGWTISGGVASSSGSNNYAGLTQLATLTLGKLYSITFTISSYTSGTLKAAVGNTSGVSYTSAGTFTETFVYTTPEPSGRNIGFYPWSAFVGSIDNVSVREVLFDQAGAPLTLFNHPADIPRIEYNADGERLGLLVEEARTNLIEYSEDFSNAAWSKIGLTVSVDDTSSPDGTASADKIIENSGSVTPTVYRYSAFTSGTTYSYSVFAKAGERFRLSLYCNGGFSFNCVFDLNAGTASGVGATITPYGSGWYRCSVSGLATESVSANIQNRIYPDSGVQPYTGNGTSGIYIWGAQIEAGAFPTSYIPTSGATATRSADVASIPVADFGYNQSAGTVVVESQTFDITDVGRNFSLSDGTSSNVIRSQAQAGNHLIVVKSGTLTANLDVGSYSDNVFSKLGGAFAENDIAACIDGGTVATDTSSSIPSVTKLHIGGRYDGGLPLNGHIKSIKYYPRRLSNAQLQELTS